MIERDNGNVHRAAAKIIVSKSRAARGSVCNVLLSRHVSGADLVSNGDKRAEHAALTNDCIRSVCVGTNCPSFDSANQADSD
jgi:glyoxylate carboligase